MVAVDGVENGSQVYPVEQAMADSSSVLKLIISVQASIVSVTLTVDKLDAPSQALGEPQPQSSTGIDLAAQS